MQSLVVFLIFVSGFLKDFQSFIVPGFLVVCNTFCAQIAALFFIPMIIYSRFSGSNCHPNTPATAAASVAGGAAAGTTHFYMSKHCYFTKGLFPI